MISIQITELKQFMQKLLTKPVFDNFYVVSFKIQTLCEFSIDGKLNKDFYTLTEQEQLGDRNYVKWEELKPFAFSLIKGNKTPLSFHIVLMMSPENTNKIVDKCGRGVTREDVTGLFLNIHFEKGTLVLITGSSRKSFTMDKTLDGEWEEQLKQFLKHWDIV